MQRKYWVILITYKDIIGHYIIFTALKSWMCSMLEESKGVKATLLHRFHRCQMSRNLRGNVIIFINKVLVPRNKCEAARPPRPAALRSRPALFTTLKTPLS